MFAFDRADRCVIEIIFLLLLGVWVRMIYVVILGGEREMRGRGVAR